MGAGKSHLLKLVYQRAQEQSARDNAARVQHATDDLTVPMTVTVPVMFQPWKYEHEPHLHVPMPALTREQAGAFVRKYESDIEPDAALRWFDEPAQPEPVMGYRLGEPGQPHPGRQVLAEHRPNDLLESALSGFDAFMPRKLIRLVELLHQLAAIARLRQKPLQLTYAGEVDVRVVLVLLLIQLFQLSCFA